MNLRSPDAPQPGAGSEGAALRFLRWLLRAVGFVVYAVCVGLDDGPGNAGVGRGGGKPGEPPARDADDRCVDSD
jgi:hypothetical protein